MTTTMLYTLNKTKQLIDLNGDSTNFRLNFRATSKDGKPFFALVADQTTLDTNPSLEYKEVKTGEISGEVSSLKNIFQNFFLVLKADDLVECTVQINKEELPITTPPAPVRAIIEPKKTDWVKIALIIGVVVGGGLLIMYYFKKAKNSKTEKKTNSATAFSFERSPSLYGGSPLKSPDGTPQNNRTPLKSSAHLTLSKPPPSLPIGGNLPPSVPPAGNVGGSSNPILDRLKKLKL